MNVAYLCFDSAYFVVRSFDQWGARGSQNRTTFDFDKDRLYYLVKQILYREPQVLCWRPWNE